MVPPWLTELHMLLALPDPPELKHRGHHRGHHITVAGDPQRRRTVLLPLLTRWAVTRQVQNDPPPFIGRARKGFRLIVAERRKRA